MKKTSYKIVTVTWLDAASTEEYLTKEAAECFDGIIIVSAGILVKITKHVVVLARDILTSQKRYRNVMAIPRPYILDLQIRTVRIQDK